MFVPHRQRIMCMPQCALVLCWYSVHAASLEHAIDAIDAIGFAVQFLK